jgi:RNA polymerase sigma-70 factor (TIGR02943 family)
MLTAQQPDARDFAQELAAMRPTLVKLARRSVRNEAWAEDAVSETLVAALEQPQAFAGRAKARTWVVGILKHKLVDQVRRHTRECPLPAADDDGDEFAAEHDAPASWGDPQATLARRQFAQQVDAAMAALPSKQSRAFMLYECLEQDTGDVCAQLGVTPNHLGVILYRARNRLRKAIAPQWHGSAALMA